MKRKHIISTICTLIFLCSSVILSGCDTHTASGWNCNIVIADTGANAISFSAETVAPRTETVEITNISDKDVEVYFEIKDAKKIIDKKSRKTHFKLCTGETKEWNHVSVGSEYTIGCTASNAQKGDEIELYVMETGN